MATAGAPSTIRAATRRRPVRSGAQLHGLRAADWTFADSDTRELSHGIHPYPARMVPALPKRLIPLLTRDRRARVHDCFAGSGTVLLEAMRAGRAAQGFDINPLALLIARVKTRPVSGARLDAFEKDLERFLAAPREGRPAEATLADASERFGIVRPEDWFPPPALQDLIAIGAWLEPLAVPVREIGLVALSRSVRSASYVRPGSFKLYRRAPEDRRRHRPDVYGDFATNARDVLARVRTLTELGPSAPVPELAYADARAVRPHPHDLLLTSPPYGDSRTTVAYGQFSELSSKVLRLAAAFSLSPRDLRQLDAALLGGRSNDAPLASARARQTERRIRATRPDRADQFHSFFADYQVVLERQLEALRPGGYAVFVVGNRTVARVGVPMDVITKELAQHVGLRHVRTFYRHIPTKVLPSRNAPENVAGRKGATMTREGIVVLRRSR